jgi:glycosyltransferase involved in cell wall biosynthesis
MAAGTPVIAFGNGGALETVVEGITGEFFTPQTAEALAKALLDFDERHYDPAVCRARAAQFDTAVFMAAFRDLAERVFAGTIASATVIG